MDGIIFAEAITLSEEEKSFVVEAGSDVNEGSGAGVAELPQAERKMISVRKGIQKNFFIGSSLFCFN